MASSGCPKPHELSAPDFSLNAVECSRLPLGCEIVRVTEDGCMRGRVVEVEAYCGVVDRGCHSYQGRRGKKNASMFSKGGVAYVYQIHGYNNLNVICSGEEDPQGVLIRAVEPLEGERRMRELRSLRTGVRDPSRRPSPEDWGVTDLCSGPAKLCQAFEVDRVQHDGAWLLDGGDLFLAPGAEVAADNVCISPRVGIDYAGPWLGVPLRFSVKGSPFVSSPKPRNAKTR